MAEPVAGAPVRPSPDVVGPVSHDAYSDDMIAGILNSVRIVAMAGASANTSRPSYFVLKYLLAKGYEVHPINPGLAGQTLLGRKVYASLSECPAPVDMLDIFRSPEFAPALVAEAIKEKDRLGLKVVWMQLGVRHDAAAVVAEAAGLTVVMNRCPKIEYGRLSGEIGWAGVNSNRISSVRPRLDPRGVQGHLIEKR